MRGRQLHRSQEQEIEAGHGPAMPYELSHSIQAAVDPSILTSEEVAHLREKEEQYRSIFEATDDGLVITDLNGVVVEANPAFCRMHGYTRAELIGADERLFVHPESYDIYRQVVENVKNGSTFYGQGLGRRKDGSHIHVEGHASNFIYGGRPHILWVIRDVTERIDRERDLLLAEQQYRSIFEATSDGLAINDLDGNLVEVNPAFCKMHGYTREEMLQLRPEQIIHPTSHELFRTFVDTVGAGGTFQGRAIDVRKDGTLFHVEVHGSGFMYKGKPHLLGVTRDITERVQAYELLEQRVAERTHELTTLLEVSQNVASTLELQPLITRVLEQIKLVIDYTGSAIAILHDGKLSLMESRGLPRSVSPDIVVTPENLGIIWESLTQGDPVVIRDVHEDSPWSRTFIEAFGPYIEGNSMQVRSWLGVPLKLKERTIGLLALSHHEPARYSARQARLVMAVANQAALAIENARLYQRAQEASRVTSALAEIASRVAFGGSLQETLDDICSQVVQATGALAAAVGLIDESNAVRFAGTYGLPEGYREAMNRVLESGVRLLAHEAFTARAPVVLDDMRRRVLATSGYAPLHPFMHIVPWDMVVAVPMSYGGTPKGILLSYLSPGATVGETEMAFHTALADQAAVAVQNALLLTQVHDKAALEERARLARELHDSVSQALFSMGLTARSVEILLQRGTESTETLLKHVGDLRQLTQAALADMRALIFELRPGALEEEGLLRALQKHAAGVQGRQLLQIEVLCGLGDSLPRLKPPAEEALYRVAQEALHNVVKHARASSAVIKLDVNDDCFILEVSDDGVGFDTDEAHIGHMGLGTMRQRVTALGGEYTVHSVPGQGTAVTARVNLSRWQLNPQTI